MSDETPSFAAFPSWSFDKPCTSMEWNELESIEMTLQADGSVEQLGDADLVIVTVQAPAPESDDEEEKEEEKETPVNLSGLLKDLDDKLGGAIKALMEENVKDFKHGAKLASTTPTLRAIGDKPQRYIVMGLGVTPKEPKDRDDKPTEDPFATSGHALGKAVAEKCDSEKKIGSVKVVLPSSIAGNGTTMKDFSASFYQSLYCDNRYRTGKNVKKAAESLKSVTVVAEGNQVATATAIESGKKIAKGIILTKDIVNSPHNVLNSLSLADTAKRIAAESAGRITCTIHGKEECEKLGMGSYLGVARGSETPPQFIHLIYTPPNGNIVQKVGIVGKGLLFDTGGYNIKVAMMELMKFDCGGAAAVLGAARAIGGLQPEGVEAHFIVAACENMINEKAYVPSDILQASNGKTIEVLNTDAEGRLTLADALVYADKEAKCDKIIELSTLTGACIVSLGTGMAGVWTTNDKLAGEIEQVSKATGDKTWRMPMEMSYAEDLKSKIADLKNIGGTRFGGAIHAALFLQNFVHKKKPFAHIDIAGPTWDWKGSVASGFGTKLVAEWIQRQGTAKEA